jgi:putative glycosyltransferase (TIGR04372 family)
MTYQIRIIISLFVLSPLFFLIGLIKLIYNINKIIKADKILLYDYYGFGPSVVLPDIIRYENKFEKHLIVYLFQSGRHNKHSLDLFEIDQILVLTGIIFKFRNRKIYLGEFERTQFLNRIYIKKILNFFKKKKSKVYGAREYYDYLLKKYYPNRYSVSDFEPKYSRHGSCWYYISEFNTPFKLKKKLVDKVKYKLTKIQDGRKICTILIRNKGKDSNITSSVRDTNIDSYFKSINYIIKKNYIIFLVGDVYTKKYFDEKNIISYKKLGISRELYDIYASTECDFYIGCEGGAQVLAHYKKNRINVNQFPYGHPPLNGKTLYKKVFNNGLEVDEEVCLKDHLFKLPYNQTVIDKYSNEVVKKNPLESNDNAYRMFAKEYTWKDNSEDEILEFVRKNIP